MSARQSNVLEAHILRSRCWRTLRPRIDFELSELGYPAAVRAELLRRAEIDYWAGQCDSIALRLKNKGEVAAIHKLPTEAARLVKGQIRFLF